MSFETRSVRRGMKAWIIGLLGNLPCAWAGNMVYEPAPVDNPLKGLVPYVSASQLDQFPHSMQFRYFALKDLMKGRGEFDWSPIEETLKLTQARGCQLVARVFLEYPGRGNTVPEFLIEEGVKVTEWKGGGEVSFTPNYDDPKLRLALAEFIAAFGKRYDGDPRIGFITAGILGSWGEWHTHPREDLWASKEVQKEVLDALGEAFSTTPVLLRYPSNGQGGNQARNVNRGFGYHDDSFGWATSESGREVDDWFFMAKMKEAGALEAWKTMPIGGEIRPELWKQSFTDSPHRRDQGFLECVNVTHVSWLMDSGLFSEGGRLPKARRDRAMKEVRRMGYEYHASSWRTTEAGGLVVSIENRGVAPFYWDWQVELEVVEGGSSRVIKQSGLLTGILPDESRDWCFDGVGAADRLRLRVSNPMMGGKPLRFANEEQKGEWLELLD